MTDAIRAGCAEAKKSIVQFRVVHLDAIRAGCAEAKICRLASVHRWADAIRAGCAEAKRDIFGIRKEYRDAIRAGCSETNGRALYSNDHAQNNEINRKESYPIQSSNQIALFYE